ncbi:MAG TPA: hypothetical protein VFA69_00425 [Candidatus Nitrosotalea sp.]|nr:hypothetical protein [Candidatus Nitrosotalea sp.]
MQHKLVVISLIVIFAVSISQRESFAPIIPSSNASDIVSNQTTQTSGSMVPQNNLWYAMIIVGIIIGVILIYFIMIRNGRS